MATNNMINVPLILSTGTGNYVGSNSPTFVTPTLGAASATSLSFSSTAGIIGTTTNNAAAALSVGEEAQTIVLLSGASSITTATPANVTSVSLTAGDWDVWGNVGCNGNAATLVQSIQGWTSTTSATLPDGSLVSGPSFGSTGLAVFSQTYYNFCVPIQRYSLSGTTTIYLSIQSTFSVNTNNAFGAIYARRRR